MVEPAISTTVGRIGELAVQETKFLCGVTSEAGFLKDELERLQCFLQDAGTKRKSGNASAKLWVSQIRNATYEAENVLEVVDYMEKRNRLKKGFMGTISRSYQFMDSRKLYIIDVSDLINSWIAESFLPGSIKNKEQMARKYVTELAQRSLVQVTYTSKVHGWIESIRLHDILHDWCIGEATDAGFCDVIDKTTGHVVLSYRSSLQNYYEDNMFEAAPQHLISELLLALIFHHSPYLC
ncbi:putative late blight resistance protein homolog R1A-3 [Panicum virgatum]|uniref:putative late blight resistance protein homolog R1A-3 n=1 Tax=Panicum virgatum TaxID=38727 RepID=UPI0019D5A90A|nr:putative late blight resistance protein homolog R1A-3 [Panicum virgatum]